MMEVSDCPLNLTANRLSHIIGTDYAWNYRHQVARPEPAAGPAIAVKCISHKVLHSAAIIRGISHLQIAAATHSLHIVDMDLSLIHI